MESDKWTLPGEQSQAYRLLCLIALSGEMPASLVKRLSGGERYKKKIIDTLKTRDLIYTHYRDGLRGLRLTRKAKVMLLSDNDSRFSFFVDGGADTNLLKSEITRRIRLHRISETYVSMLNSGVSIFRDEKPDIFYPDDCDMQPPAFDGPAFYSSREVKELGDDSIRIRGSRAVGTLLTYNNIFIVYNSGGSLMKWGRKAELRYKTLMRVVLCQERLPYRYQPDNIYGLIMGDDMELAYKMLTSTGGAKRSYFMLDDNFEHFCYLTNDHRGEVILRILCDAELKSRLHSALSNGLYLRDPGITTEHDATDENGAPVLFAYDVDMPRIARFDTSLRIQDKQGVITCFDFQADVLSRYCGENIKLRLISFEKLEGRFFS